MTIALCMLAQVPTVLHAAQAAQNDQDVRQAGPQPGEEIAAKRTRNSKTLATEEVGKYRTIVANGPIHFKDAGGQWQEIRTDLVEDEDMFRNRANSFDLEFRKNARSTRIATLRVDPNHAVGFGFRNAAASQAEPAADAIIFKGARPSVDLKLTSQAGGVKEDIILRNPNTPRIFEFPLYLEGLTATVDDGAVSYKDEAGVERVRTPKPFMEDSDINEFSGEPTRSYDIRYELTGAGSALTLRVIPSDAWLDDPARIYPVTLDPSFWLSTTLDDDMFVGEGWYNDFSTEPDLKIGRYSTSAPLHKSYMHFDVSGLNGKIINDATFFIWNTWSYSCSPRGVGFYRITEPWNGHAMRSAGPAMGEQIGWQAFAAGYEPGGCGDGWAFFNVAGTVRNWTSNPNVWAQHGVGIRVDSVSESDIYAWKQFASWNTGLTLNQCPIPVSTPASAYLTKCIPHIDILWSEPNRRPNTPFYVSPAANVTLNYPNPSLAANNTDDDGNNVALRFRLYREADGAYMGGKDGGFICNGCQDSWYAGPLRDGRYYWDEWAWDGQLDSPIGRNYFTIAVPPDVPPASDLSPASGTVGAAAPTLKARYNDGNGAQDPDGGAIDFQIADANYQPISTIRVTAANGQLASYMPNLAQGAYNWRAQAWDGLYPSASWTSWRSFAIGQQPGAPTSPTATGIDNGGIAVTWGPPTSNGGLAITGYTVRAFEELTGTLATQQSACATCTSAALAGLVDGVLYRVEIMATNAAGTGPAAVAPPPVRPGWENCPSANPPCTLGAPDLGFTSTGSGYETGDYAANVVLGRNGKDPFTLRLPTGARSSTGAFLYDQVVLTPTGAGRDLGKFSVPAADQLLTSSKFGTWDRRFDARTDGVETTDFIKSASAPIEYGYSVSLPTGWSMTVDGFNRITFRDSAGIAVGGASAPAAVDASGTAVPVAVALAGGAITIGVPHTALAYQYPVIVDPYYYVGGRLEGAGQGPNQNEHLKWSQDRQTLTHAHREGNQWVVDAEVDIDLSLSLNGRGVRTNLSMSLRPRPAGFDDRIAYEVEIQCKESRKGRPDRDCEDPFDESVEKPFRASNRDEPEEWRDFYRFTPDMIVGPIPDNGRVKYFFEVYVRPFVPEGNNGNLVPGFPGLYRTYDISCFDDGTCFFDADEPTGDGT